jgi:hypothetical protein
MEIFKHFVSYTRELALDVEDHTDLLAVADLCRLQLQMWRTDMSMKLETEIIDEAISSTMAKGSTTILKKRVGNANRTAQAAVRNDISKIYKQLLATREDKLKKKLTATEMTESLSVMLSKLTNYTNKKE